MISLTTKYICSLTSTLSRRYSRAHRATRAKTDPGIHKRKAILGVQEFQQEFQDMELDDLETDFMDVHKSYKQHREEVEVRNEQLKYITVKNKYFKEKFPNFLTWTDKEQMRLLHSTDPEEWTIEKLSESFPALPEVIKKVLKAKFSKGDSKMKNHDATVEKNWQKFRKGKLTDLPPDLVEHLNKFTNRKVNVQLENKKKEIVNKPKIQSEFSEIITGYQRLKNKVDTEKDEVVEVNLSKNFKSRESLEKNTYLPIKKEDIKDKRPITLTQLKDNIERKASRGLGLSAEEENIYVNTHQQEEDVVVLNKEDVSVIPENKYTNNAGCSLTVKTEKDYSHLIYPEKIVIPKKLIKKGYTYRLNDCYYDYDGEFLYRVPGMG
ncbi:uncharacterized protein LOC114327848 [Diabrotica virgifera virgifera]|uniref:Neurite outgrowth-associated protein n=1 Tax=Diabrotica virgifera virgifera TaxID=50390 RepID=A0ABM5IGN6_DIAVI|nr:uncharacterized protein LOC114327848 [Diabrotica virgifera virgifera]